jgi:uncharacterized protein involved in outer membrane biogenesis
MVKLHLPKKKQPVLSDTDEPNVHAPRKQKQTMSVHKALMLVVYVGAIFIFLMGCAYVLVDKDKVAKQIYALILKETGYAAHADRVTFSLLPLPKVTMENLIVENDKRSALASIVEIDEASFELSFVSILKGGAGTAFGSIELFRPMLLLERYPDNGSNWEFMKRFSASKMGDLPVSSISIVDADIKHKNLLRNEEKVYRHLSALFSKGLIGGWSFDGNVEVEDMVNKFTGSVDFAENSSDASASMKPDITWRDDNGQVSYKGTLDVANGQWIFNGDLNLTTKDVIPWMTHFIKQEDLDVLGHALEEKQPIELTMKLAGNKKEQQFRDVKVKLSAGSGVGQIALERSENPHAKMFWDVSELNVNKLLAGTDSDDFSGAALEVVLSKILELPYPTDLKMQVKKLIFSDGLPISVDIAGNVQDLQINLDKVHVGLQTKIAFDVAGRVYKDPAARIVYEGQVETSGEHFLDFVHGNGLELLGLIVPTNDSYKIGMKVSAARDQTIISNIELASGGLKITGGLNVSNILANEIKGTIEVDGGHLDKIFTTALNDAKGNTKNSFDVSPIFLPWLEQVAGSYNLNIVLKNYAFGDAVQDTTSLVMKIMKNKLDISNVDLVLGSTRMRGNVKYEQGGASQRPKVMAKVELSALNFKSDAGESSRILPVPKGNRQPVWSRKMFDFNRFQGFDAEIELKVRRVYHNLFTVDSAVGALSAKDDVWQLKQMQGSVWGGILQAEGQLSLGTIPAASVVFSLNNIPSERFLSSFMGLNGMKGPMSITGQVTASGLNLDGWMSNNSGSFTVSAYNNVINGFDLPALVSLVPRVKAVEEIQNVANDYLLVNQTELDTLAGGFSLENGVLFTDSVNLRTRDAVGKLRTKVDLKTWMMDAVFEFKLLTLSRGDYPSVSILFKDSMDNPEVALDLRALEAFLARRGAN